MRVCVCVFVLRVHRDGVPRWELPRGLNLVSHRGDYGNNKNVPPPPEVVVSLVRWAAGGERWLICGHHHHDECVIMQIVFYFISFIFSPGTSFGRSVNRGRVGEGHMRVLRKLMTALLLETNGNARRRHGSNVDEKYK